MKPSPEQLSNMLMHFYGSINFYRHPLNRSLIYTEGIQYFAEAAGAYWFIDLIAFTLFKHTRSQSFINIIMTVADGKATIRLDDGDDNLIVSKHIEFTDCPAG